MLTYVQLEILNRCPRFFWSESPNPNTECYHACSLFNICGSGTDPVKSVSGIQPLKLGFFCMKF